MSEYCLRFNIRDLTQSEKSYIGETFLYQNILIAGEIRIDNKRDLITSENFNKDVSNAELIALLYQKYGDNFKHKIHGAFAFLLHDKSKATLSLIRDHVGQKIIYYSFHENFVYVSSSIENFFKFSGIKKNMNLTRVIDFIAHTHSINSETFFEKIHYVMPSNTLSIKTDEIKEKEFNFQSNLHDDKDLKTLFFESVNAVREENCGSMLSGGLDSSAISVALQYFSKDPIETFSITFPELKKELREKADEEEYSSEVVKKKRMNSNKIPIKDFNFVENIKENSKFFEEPFMATNTYIYEKVFQEMKKKDIKLILDGTDGDSVISHGKEIFSHYGERFEIKKLLKEKRSYDEKHNTVHSPLKTLFQYVVGPWIPRWIYRPYKRIRNKDYYYSQNILLNKTYRKSNKELYRNVETIYKVNKDFLNFSDKAHFMMVYRSHWDDVFNILNTIAKKNNVEIRFPFFYQPLVNHCLKQSVTKKIKKGVTRYYFREALKDILPKKIYERHNKSDLSPIFFEHFMNIDSSYANQVFFDESSPIYNLIDQNQIKKLISSKNKRKNLAVIFTFFSLYEWMKKNDFKIHVVKK